jgi:lipoprotein NlpD
VFALAALCLWWLSGCAATGRDEETEVYVVRAQDTLYSIAWRNDLDYRDLARWNGLGADFRITVGERLLLKPRIVTAAGGNAGSAAQGAAGSAARRASSEPTPLLRAAPTDASTVARVDRPQPLPDALGAPAPPLAWVWPTDRTAAPRPVAGGGILLAGRLGQPVRAAAAGRIVYAGSGLRGYGKLIIIKHAEALLSAYAHNQQLLVREGQDVSVGQTIAVMGEGAPNKPVLYFEIRSNGRPTDPIPYLTGKK